jgi:hypothetical protein
MARELEAGCEAWASYHGFAIRAATRCQSDLKKFHEGFLKARPWREIPAKWRSQMRRNIVSGYRLFCYARN